jgi:hypothetical protein
VLYTPFLQGIFGVSGPGFDDWGTALLFTAIGSSALEVGKHVASKRRQTSLERLKFEKP